MNAVLQILDKNHDGYVDVLELEKVGVGALPSFEHMGAEGHHYDVESGTFEHIPSTSSRCWSSLPEFFLHHEGTHTQSTSAGWSYLIQTFSLFRKIPLHTWNANGWLIQSPRRHRALLPSRTNRTSRSRARIQVYRSIRRRTFSSTSQSWGGSRSSGQAGSTVRQFESARQCYTQSFSSRSHLPSWETGPGCEICWREASWWGMGCWWKGLQDTEGCERQDEEESTIQGGVLYFPCDA